MAVFDTYAPDSFCNFILFYVIFLITIAMELYFLYIYIP